MVFSSLIFLYAFLPLCLIFTHLASKTRTQNYVLLAFSLFFYAWGEPFWVILMIMTGVFIWLTGLAIDKHRAHKTKKKLYLTLAIIIALSSLAVFKYAGFFFQNINAVFGTNLSIPSFSLPIGISFYTFQTLTYVIDLYRGHVKVQKSVLNLLLYESLFPQLIAGPIVRYADIDDQINRRTISLDGIRTGIGRFLAGLAKKVLIANMAGEIVDLTLNSGHLAQLDGLEAMIGILAYTFQIYFDFSGYSDMAIGLGHMFGFNFKENFRHPYIARSVTDFWRRWHISLSTFFRDYVYIPLGGNRRGLPVQIRNMLIVWGLTGLWHGASWNFILWGLYYFVLLTVEKIGWLSVLERLPKIVGHLYLALVVIFGWALFYFVDMSELGIFLGRLFVPRSGYFGVRGVIMLKNHGLFLILATVASLPVLPRIRAWLRSLANRLSASDTLIGGLQAAFNIILLLLSTASLAASSFNPFLYFRF